MTTVVIAVHSLRGAGAAHPAVAEVVGEGIGVAPGVTAAGVLTGGFGVVALTTGEWLAAREACCGCARIAARAAADSSINWTRPGSIIRADPRAMKVARLVWRLLADCGLDDDPAGDCPGAPIGYQVVDLPGDPTFADIERVKRLEDA